MMTAQTPDAELIARLREKLRTEFTKENFGDIPDEDCQEASSRLEVLIAERNAIIEQCAKVAEGFPLYAGATKAMAAAIRALKKD